MTSEQQSFFIPLKLPGMNEIIDAAHRRKGKWSQYGEMKRTYSQLIAREIRAAKLRPIKAQYVAVFFVWHEETRKRDKDNIRAGAKFILDALQARRILTTDGWAQVDSLIDQFVHAPGRPGVEVVLRYRKEELRG